MSSKQARKLLLLQQEQAAAKAAAEAKTAPSPPADSSPGDDESGGEEVDSSPAPQPKRSAFAALMSDSDDSDDDSDTDHGPPAPEEAPEVEEPAPSSDEKKKSVKPKKKVPKSSDTEDEEPSEDDEDDWKALEEAEKERGMAVDPSSATASSAQTETAPLPSLEYLLRVQKPNFSSEAEYRRIFGKAAVPTTTKSKEQQKSERQWHRATGGQAPAHFKKIFLAQDMEYAEVGVTRPDVAAGGSAHMTEPRRDIFHLSSVPNSAKAKDLEETYVEICRQQNPDLLMAFIRQEGNLHADALLVLAEMLRMQGEMEQGLKFLKKALFVLECNFLGTFKPFAEGSFPLRKPEASVPRQFEEGLWEVGSWAVVNSPSGSSAGASSSSAGATGAASEQNVSTLRTRPQSLSPRAQSVLGRALWLYMVTQGEQGLFNTALEVGKLLWKLTYFGGENSRLWSAKWEEPQDNYDNFFPSEAECPTTGTSGAAGSDDGASPKTYKGFDPAHLLIHVLFYAVRARKYEVVELFCGFNGGVVSKEAYCASLPAEKLDPPNPNSLRYFDADRFRCFTSSSVKAVADPPVDGTGKKFRRPHPALSNLYPPMCYTMALTAFFQAESPNQLRHFQNLAVSDICNWTKPGRDGAERLCKALYLYPFVFRMLLEKAEVSLDSKPASSRGISNPNHTWRILLDKLDGFGVLNPETDFPATAVGGKPKGGTGLRGLEVAYVQRFFPLWKSDPVLQWCHECLVKLVSMFEQSSLFLEDWRRGVEERVSYLRQKEVLECLYGCYDDMSTAEFVDSAGSMLPPPRLRDDGSRMGGRGRVPGVSAIMEGVMTFLVRSDEFVAAPFVALTRMGELHANIVGSVADDYVNRGEESNPPSMEDFVLRASEIAEELDPSEVWILTLLLELRQKLSESLQELAEAGRVQLNRLPFGGNAQLLLSVVIPSAQAMGEAVGVEAFPALLRARQLVAAAAAEGETSEVVAAAAEGGSAAGDGGAAAGASATPGAGVESSGTTGEDVSALTLREDGDDDFGSARGGDSDGEAGGAS